MTVASEINISGPYTGNGVTTVFEYDFRVLDASHIQVVKTTDNGAGQTLTLYTDYTVGGVGEASGGAVTVYVAPTNTQTLTIIRDVPFTQEVDLENQGEYYAETVERALDLAAMRDQQLAEVLSRSIKVQIGSDPPAFPDPQSGALIGWDSEGGLENKPISLLTDATAAAQAAQEGAEDARDETVAIASALSPVDPYPFSVVLGQTYVTILPDGYQVGKVSDVFLDGLKLSGWSATDGSTVTFPAITADDLGGRGSLDMIVNVGLPTTGFGALDLRYNRKMCEVVVDLVYDADTVSPTDNRASIQSALNTGRTVVIPDDMSGNGGWAGYAGCLYQTTPGQVVHDFSRKLSLDPSLEGNGEVWPMWIQTQTAIGAQWVGGTFDHRGMDWVSATDGPGAANVGFASALLLMAERGQIIRPQIFNGFDNGLGFMAADLETGAQSPGGPALAQALFGYSENCGVGIHTHDAGIGPHQVGGGVNLLSGSRALVDGWRDRLSRQNFIADYAGGASGKFIGCTGEFAQISSMGTQSFEGETIPIGGFGIYCGATHVKWIGCEINDAAQWGAWFDGFSANNEIDLDIKYCGRGGALINGRGHRGIIRVKDAGHISTGTYPGIRVRGGHVDGDSYAIQLVAPHVEGPYAAYGLEIMAGGGGQKVYGGSDGGQLQGTLAPVANGQPDYFSVTNYRDLSNPKYLRDLFNYVNAANDGAAAAAGVPIGGRYRNGSVLMLRMS